MAMAGTFESVRGVKISSDEVDTRKPRCRCLDLVARFIRKEFGPNWEEQYQEYDEFWRDYFTTPYQN